MIFDSMDALLIRFSNLSIKFKNFFLL